MITRIWWRDKWCNAKPERPPHDTRQLRSFLLYNNTADCFMKGEGGWYKITKEGTILFVIRALYLMSLEEFYLVAVNDNFIANHKQ